MTCSAAPNVLASRAFLKPGILRRKFVALLAMGLVPECTHFAPADIFCLSDWFKMVWVYAILDAAEMVNN